MLPRCLSYLLGGRCYDNTNLSAACLWSACATDKLLVLHLRLILSTPKHILPDRAPPQL